MHGQKGALWEKTKLWRQINKDLIPGCTTHKLYDLENIPQSLQALVSYSIKWEQKIPTTENREVQGSKQAG